MPTTSLFSVTGVRADGTIGARIPSNNLKKAKFLAQRLQALHSDWKVEIRIPQPPRPRKAS